MEKINDAVIINFWDWFKKKVVDIENDPNDKNLISQLDEKVLSLGDFEWEYGPSDFKEWYFCISPSFQKELKPIADQIISYAPELKNWEFRSSRPPKKWTGTWNIYDENGNSISIDSEKWQVLVFKFPDGTYDLDIKIDTFFHSEELMYSAVNILIANIVGEEKYMNLIENIKIVDSFEENEAKTVLAKDLDKII